MRRLFTLFLTFCALLVCQRAMPFASNYFGEATVEVAEDCKAMGTVYFRQQNGEETSKIAFSTFSQDMASSLHFNVHPNEGYMIDYFTEANGKEFEFVDQSESEKYLRVQVLSDDQENPDVFNFIAHFKEVPSAMNVWVLDQPVTNNNYTDVLGDGTVSFNPDHNRLTLRNANLCDKTKNNAIRADIPITIRVEGTNTIEVNGAGILSNTEERNKAAGSGTGLFIYGNDTDAKLTIKNANMGIYARGGAGLRLDGINLNIDGVQLFGISGNENIDDELILSYNVKIKTSETINYAIGGFGKIDVWKEDVIITPDNVGIGKNKRGISGFIDLDTKEYYKGELSYGYEKPYHIEVNGTELTSSNAANIASGVTYDASSHTLHINQVNLDDIYIQGECKPGLCIEVQGHCQLKHISSGVDCTLLGADETAQLDVIDIDRASIYVWNKAALTIDNLRLQSKGKWGICGDHGEETLTIRNSDVVASGLQGSIIDFGNVTLEGCSYTQPQGICFSPSAHAAVDSEGQVVTTDIIIARDATAITAPNADQPQSPTLPTYNLQGQRVDQRYKGIVVKNGKKTLR